MKFALAATAFTLATAVSALTPNCVEEYVGKDRDNYYQTAFSIN